MNDTTTINITVRKKWLEEVELVCEQIGLDKEDVIRLVTADWINQRKLEFAERGIYLEK